MNPEHVRREQQQAHIRALEAAAGQIDVRSTGQGVELISRAGRNMSMTVMVLLMGLIFAGISIGLWFWAEEEGSTGYLMALAFGLFGFPLTLGGLFMAGRSLHTRIEGTQVRALRCWAGRRLWQRQGQLTRADQLVIRSAGSMTRGRRVTEYFSLELDTGGQRLRIAEGIAGREVAAALRDNLITLLRLGGPGSG